MPFRAARSNEWRPYHSGKSPCRPITPGSHTAPAAWQSASRRNALPPRSRRTCPLRQIDFKSLVSEECRLFVGIPDVLQQLPFSAYLLPDDGVFQGAVLRRLSLCFKAASADFPCRVTAERLHVERRAFDVANLLHLLSPEDRDRVAALHHLGARRQHIGVFGVHCRQRRGVTLVEGFGPFVVRFLDHPLALGRCPPRNQHQARDEYCDLRHPLLPRITRS